MYQSIPSVPPILHPILSSKVSQLPPLLPKMCKQSKEIIVINDDEESKKEDVKSKFMEKLRQPLAKQNGAKKNKSKAKKKKHSSCTKMSSKHVKVYVRAHMRKINH